MELTQPIRVPFQAAPELAPSKLAVQAVAGAVVQVRPQMGAPVPLAAPRPTQWAELELLAARAAEFQEQAPADWVEPLVPRQPAPFAPSALISLSATGFSLAALVAGAEAVREVMAVQVSAVLAEGAAVAAESY